MLKHVFSVIEDKSIGSINRNKLDNVKFSSLNRVRKNILRSIRENIKEAIVDKDYYSCLRSCIKETNNSDLKINYDMMKLAKRVLSFNTYSEERVMDIFLQYQYLQSSKELKGLYILNVHQSKGREFDYVYIIDREKISKDENLLYVALSRVKEKLVVFDWAIKE